ncbi:MAG: peptidase sortase [Parcubacteria group bacterium]|nr:peptidase sortase [Parcubacteria group bacterium]
MNLKKLTGFGIVIAAILVLGFTVRHAVYYAPDTEVTPPAMVLGTTTTSTMVSAQSPEPSQPLRLIIPSIGVNANVQYVGVKADGSMGTPNNFTDVAWYKYGPVPGDTGSSVIDGHVDNALALSGVFKHLGDVKIGDDIYVMRKDGTKLHFRVMDTEMYSYKTAPNEKIFATEGGKFLNLITCAGTWIKGEHSYDERLVVYTELVS